jgi:hypothetical protein
MFLKPSIGMCRRYETRYIALNSFNNFLHITLTTVAIIDKASQVLAQGVPPGVSNSYRALADHSNIPRYTLYHRAHGRRSIEEKAQGQQYLTP